MRSVQTANDPQGYRSILGSLACAVILAVGASSPSAYAMNIATPRAPGSQVNHSTDVIEIRAVARGGRVAVGPRGGVAVRRTTVVRPGVRPPVVRPGYAGGGVRWARPGWYGWPRGGAIAAGAAIGVVTAATAAAWAGAAPAPGMCWYYTDPSRTQGFWDYCR
jgi:hypothetical protein